MLSEVLRRLPSEDLLTVIVRDRRQKYQEIVKSDGNSQLQYAFLLRITSSSVMLQHSSTE